MEIASSAVICRRADMPKRKPFRTAKHYSIRHCALLLFPLVDERLPFTRR